MTSIFWLYSELDFPGNLIHVCFEIAFYVRDSYAISTVPHTSGQSSREPFMDECVSATLSGFQLTLDNGAFLEDFSGLEPPAPKVAASHRKAKL